MNKRRIVITGIGVLSPIGIGQEEFTKALREGKSGANLIDSFDTADYACKIGANVKNFQPEDFIDRKKARRMAGLHSLAYLRQKWQ